MESRVEQAIAKRKSGYNCAQAVACTYCDFAGIDEETMFCMMQAFGTGLGTMQGTCGAISGACSLIGLINKKNQVEEGSFRAKTMQNTRQIMSEFYDRNHSVICKELKGIETGVVLRGCEDCIRDAAEFLEKSLQEGQLEL